MTLLHLVGSFYEIFISMHVCMNIKPLGFLCYNKLITLYGV
jgi:hypothetical protein